MLNERYLLHSSPSNLPGPAGRLVRVGLFGGSARCLLVAHDLPAALLRQKSICDIQCHHAHENQRCWGSGFGSLASSNGAQPIDRVKVQAVSATARLCSLSFGCEALAP